MTPLTLPLAGRTAVVTGASTGLGASIVRSLLAAGATVHGIAGTASRLQSVAPDELRDGTYIPHALDVADSMAAEQRAHELATNTPVDILVCAAGTNVPTRRFRELSFEDFDQIIKTNIYGAFT